VNETPDHPVAARIRAELGRDLAWAARAPAAEPTWARVREEAAAVLTRLWRAGELVGATPDEAFFVRCDRTTMTQDDLDNGRLVVQIGVAVVRPAEFVILRIGEFAPPRRRPWWRRALGG
jgi:phage tail sheath protein FI